MIEKIRKQVVNATISKIFAAYLISDVLFGFAKSNLFAVFSSVRIIHNADLALPLLHMIFSGFSSEITTIEHLIAAWIFVVTTQKISRQTRYFPKFEERVVFWCTVAAQWLLFMYFLILLGSPTPALLGLPREIQWAVLLSFSVMPLLIVVVIPYCFELINTGFPQSSYLDLQLQEILTAITLFPAALAVIFEVGPLLEIFVLLGLILYPFSKLLGWRVDIEQRLLHLLIRLDDGDRGFALGMVILTGLYLASWAANHLWIQLTFLRVFLTFPKYHIHYPPFLLGLILSVAIGGASIFWWTHLSFSDWDGGTHRNPLLVGSGILILEGGIIAYLLEFLSNRAFKLSLSNPVVFAIALSVCITMITESKYYGVPERFVVLEKLTVALLFVPAFLQSEIQSVFPIIALPAFVYYLTPVVRKLTRKTTTAISAFDIIFNKY